MRKATILCLATAASFAAIGSGTIPGTDITYDHILEKTDGGYSLTTGNSNQHWSDGYTIQEGDEDVVLYIPNGLTARTDGNAQTVIPVIYCAGAVYPALSGSRVTTFSDLRLLDGGFIDGRQVGPKAGKITILSTDPDNPARYDWKRSDEDYKYTCTLKAQFIGAADSQFLFRSTTGAKVNVKFSTGADLSGFYGTFRIDGEGNGVQSDGSVPVTMPGTMRFGNGGILLMSEASSPYSFGDLSFIDGGAITNTGSGATLTVSGTFDTGTNMRWRSSNTGTFGTLILGDGLVLSDEQAVPTTVLTVTDRLEVGANVTIRYPNEMMSQDRVLLMRLSPAAVTAGVPDLSGVAVSVSQNRRAYLETESDPDVSGGVLVYAVVDSSSIVYYNGPDEFLNDEFRGKWLDPEFAPDYWSDGLYPDDPNKTYCSTQSVAFTDSSSTFPGGTLVSKKYLYIYGSFYVEDLRVSSYGLYFRSNNKHMGGNMTATGNCVIRGYRNINTYVDAALHGSKRIEFESYYPTSEGGVTFYLTADNSDWTGFLTTTWTPNGTNPVEADETNHTRIVVGDAKALGGNPADFTYNQIRLVDYAELWFTNTTVMTAANRGIALTKGMIRVDEGQTATLMTKISPRGTLYKVGEGTLALGGGLDCRTSESENFILVKEGAIKCASLDIAKVTFSDDTGIVSDSSTGAMDLTSATVTAEGDVYLTVDGEEPVDTVTYPAVYPVVKVTEAQALALGSALKLQRAPWAGWVGDLVSESDGEGNVIYSVKYSKPGSIVVFR